MGSYNLDPPATDLLTEWVEYDNELERGKGSCNKLPPAWRLFFEQIYSFPTPFKPDHSLHGCGVQRLRPGGWLSPHLDYALHPDGIHERRLNLVLFLNNSGGALDFYDDSCTKIMYSIEPVAGRFACWEPTDVSFHGVSVNDSAVQRYTANVSFLSEKRPGVTRKRALFVPRR